MLRAVVVDVLVALAVAVTLVSSVGVLVMRDAPAKLHYVTPVSMVAPVLVGLAVLVQTGYSSRSAQTWLALLFLLIAAPFLSHATIRAARVRAEGDWRCQPSGRDGGRHGTGADAPEDAGGRQ